MKNTIIRVWHASLLGVAALLMVVALGTGLSSGRRAMQNAAWVAASYETASEVDRVVALTRDGGTEVMGFINSGGLAYLDSFYSAQPVIEEALGRLKRRIGGNSRQASRIEQLETLVLRRVDDLKEAIRLRQAKGAEEARDFILSESALRRVVELRQKQREIDAAEEAMMERHRATMSDTMRVSVFTVVITGGLSLALAVNAFLLMRRAIAALKREAGLLRAMEKAERSDREKSEFLANMSHEIRTPMNAVLGFAELLGTLATTPKQRQYVDAINTSGRALLAMINDILDLSKIEAGRLDLSLKPTSVRAVFHGISTVFDQQASERGLTLEFLVDSSVPPSIVFDTLRLRQILFNVVGNALKFTPQGSIVVKAWASLAPGDETSLTLHVSVADTGIGIARQNLQMIFEPFRQVKSAAAAGGTGLGLSITKRLTEMLNGRITVDSLQDRGTTFFFDFERVPISAALPEGELATAPDEDLDGLRPSLILVVDDVALNRDLLAGYFEGTRHRLLFASGGREAVQVAAKFRPDLVLMDIRMPEVDGRSAREQIRRIPELAALPMIAVTASSLLAEERELRNLFEGYVRKPFTRPAIHAELRKLLPADTAPESGADADAAALIAAAGEGVGAEDGGGDPESWREFLDELRKLETEVWPLLSRSMGARESEAFARDLASGARRARCGPVGVYAQKLLAQVQAFDIQEQEKTMKAFPLLVSQIAHAVEGGVT